MSIPNSLIGYRQLLEDAIRDELETSERRRRRRVLRLAVACATAAALALGLSALVDHAPWAVRPASAESVVRHAAAAIAEQPGTILHVDMTGTQRNPDGSTVTWRDQSWQSESAPYSRRQIETGADGSTVEGGSGPDGDQVYDAATNTIYTDPHRDTAKPDRLNAPRLTRGPRSGTYTLRFGKFASLVISSRQARAFRNGTLVVGLRVSKQTGRVGPKLTLIPAARVRATRDSRVYASHGSSAHDESTADPSSPAFRNEILALLQSGAARVVGHKAIDGHDTIEIASADRHNTYYVDPDSYAPVELDTTGTDGGVALRFHVYETLPAKANSSLLDLAAQHPDAIVDRNASDYDAAQRRLYPHG